METTGAALPIWRVGVEAITLDEHSKPIYVEGQRIQGRVDHFGFMYVPAVDVNEARKIAGETIRTRCDETVVDITFFNTERLGHNEQMTFENYLTEFN